VHVLAGKVLVAAAPGHAIALSRRVVGRLVGRGKARLRAQAVDHNRMPHFR
jgi:hypothetical protein